MSNGGGLSTLGLMYGLGALGGLGGIFKNPQGPSPSGQPFGDLQTLAILGLVSGSPEVLAPLALMQMAGMASSKTNSSTPTMEREQKIFHTFRERLSTKMNITNNLFD